MVRPTGKPMNEAVGKWADAGDDSTPSSTGGKQFRGEAR